MNVGLEEIISRNMIKGILVVFWGGILVLSALAFKSYLGQGFIYILFTIVSNLLLYFGFRKNAIFFDSFIGVFLWLGFWLKFSVRVIFADSLFHEPVGYFDGTDVAFDQALLVASCGLFGFLLASYIREKLSFNYPQKVEGVIQKGLFNFYLKHRKIVWTGFGVLFVAVAVSNAYLGIYQRGSITRTVLPFGFNGVYKWLLLFGFSSFSALILRFEFEINKKTHLPVTILAFLENLVSNISLLSRGMILNGGSLIYGILVALKPYAIKSNLRYFLASGLVFIGLFIGSVIVVNYLRSSVYVDSSLAVERRIQATQRMTNSLFIDRWVGMEGVMAVSSYPKKSWNLWKSALQESYNENETSFYDNILIESKYATTDKSRHHFISLPGIIAFLFYPGSFPFLFVSTFALGLAAALIEGVVFRLGGKNLILCALIAQVVAFRYVSFGYVPKQSYMLFGSILLNILIFFIADKFFSWLYSNSSKEHSRS